MTTATQKFAEIKARELGVSPDELIDLAEQLVSDGEAEELRVLIDEVNLRVPETLRVADESHRYVSGLLREPNEAEPVH